jgi:hypothetical protein
MQPSTWVKAIDKVILQLDHADRNLVPAIGAAMHESIVFGSPVTGSPGQVVADENGGNLRSGWTLDFPTPDTARSYTNVVYAESNEDGIARPGGGPYIQRSAIGGRWSVASTRVNFDRLVDHVINSGIRPEGFQTNSALVGQ